MELKIIIVGGGIGGLILATKLGKYAKKNNTIKIILIDKNSIHTWKPSLHKIAADAINKNSTSIEYSAHAKKNNFKFKLGCLKKINRKNKYITIFSNKNSQKKIEESKIQFDILVLSIGSVSNDFNISGVKENCFFLDNIKQAIFFKEKLLNLIHKIIIDDKKNSKINITIVGGGLTGIELSTEILHKINTIKNNKNIKKIFNINIIESESRILPKLSKNISAIVYKNLKKLKINITTNTYITKIKQKQLETNTKEKLKADFIIWTAGIKSPNFMKQIGGLQTNKTNQIVVKNTLQTTTDDFIFAIGDCASCPDDKLKNVPARAQAAYQMAKICNTNIISLIKKKKLKQYIYKDYGSIISLSKFKTIGIINLNKINRHIIFNGILAKIIYILLYTKHMISINGYKKTIILTIKNFFKKTIFLKKK